MIHSGAKFVQSKRLNIHCLVCLSVCLSTRLNWYKYFFLRYDANSKMRIVSKRQLNWYICCAFVQSKHFSKKFIQLHALHLAINNNQVFRCLMDGWFCSGIYHKQYIFTLNISCVRFLALKALLIFVQLITKAVEQSSLL